MTGVVALLSATLASVQVSGASACPTPNDVAAHLAALAPASAEGHPTHQIRVDPSPGGVLLELVDGSGEVVATKRLDGTGRCAELAVASAVVLATWLSSQPEPSLSVREPTPPPAPVSPPSGGVASQIGFEVSIGLTGSVADWHWGLGVLVGAALTPGGAGFGGDLQIAALGVHAVARPDGVLTWQRFALSVGPHHRLCWGTALLDVGLLGSAGLFTATSQGLEPAVTSAALDPGFSVGARLAARWGPWFALSATFWPLDRRLALAPDPLDIPKFEGLVALGIRWGPD